MWNDIRFAGCMMRRAPGFTVVAIAVLALGIGANTAIFSLINAILLQPLPFAHPSQLVQMYETERAPGSYPLSGPDFPDWKAQSKLFADMALYSYPGSVNLTGGGQPRRVTVVPAEANFFSLLGVKPALGRMFLPGEGGKNEVVLSYALWKSRFAGDAGIVGRKITLGGSDCTVIGVAPASFHLRSGVQAWTPMDMAAGKLGERGNHSYSALGRMKPGVTLAQAQAEISAIAARLTQKYPGSNAHTGAKLYLLRDRLVQAPQRASLLTLLGVVGLVLLIACADLANLLLARALGRQKEISIRLALGARRGHILRQLLTESVLLALCGAVVGAVLAWAGVRAVVGLKAFTLPQFNPIQVSGTVLAFTVGLAIVCGIVFGLAPAWQLSRPRINGELSGAGALAGAGRKRRWLSDGLIVAEVALSLLLVVGAGLFIQSFARLRASALGVNPEHLLTAELSLPDSSYTTPASITQFQNSLLQRLQALPGVEHAALSSELPLEGGSNGYISLPGQTAEQQALVEWERISPGYFATMQIPVRRGRAYTPDEAAAWNRFFTAMATAKDPDAIDMGSYHLSVVVNQAMVDHFFPGKNPIGQTFRRGTSGALLTITGVVGNVAVFGLGRTAAMPAAYFPTLVGANDFFLQARSSLPPATLAAEFRRAAASLDSSLPLFNVRTLDQVISGSVAGQALQEWLMTGFAGLALLLAIAGIYGVMSYLVAARQREIGVRMALGASRGSVLGLVVGRSLRLAAIGIVIGLAAALALGQVIASQLYQVHPADPATLAIAVLVLLAACALACYIPARRAAAVDPARALRAN